MSGRTPNDVAAFTHKVPDDWQPEVDGRGNVHIPGARCAANVGKSAVGGWVLLDQWGATWAVGFATRKDAARFAYALQLEDDARAPVARPARSGVVSAAPKWIKEGPRDWRRSDDAFKILYWQNAVPDHYGAQRNVGPYPMPAAETSAFFRTLAEAKRWCAESETAHPLPDDVTEKVR